MKREIKKLLALTLAALMVLLTFAPAKEVEAAAPAEVTIIGTIINTRDYYQGNGPVTAYGFFPTFLTTVTVGGKEVELTCCGIGTAPEFGTNDVSPWVGQLKQFTGTITKGSGKPYKYDFALKSVSDVPAGATLGTKDYMISYLTALGFQGVQGGEYAPNGWSTDGFMLNWVVSFTYNCNGGLYGPIIAVVTNAEHTAQDFGITNTACNTAKAMQAAKMLSQYATGAITRDAAEKYFKNFSVF